MTLDTKLIRAKDIVLLVGAISGMIAGVYHVYAKPFQLEARMDANEKRLEVAVADHDKITTLIEKMDNLSQAVARVEKKVDRIR